MNKNTNAHPSGMKPIDVIETFTYNLACAFDHIWSYENKKNPRAVLTKVVSLLEKEKVRYLRILAKSDIWVPSEVRSSIIEKRMKKILSHESGHRFGCLSAIYLSMTEDSPVYKMECAIQHVTLLIEELKTK